MAQHRRKRETNARNLSRGARVAAPLAVVATLSAVTMGVLSANPVTDDITLLASSQIGVPVSTTEASTAQELRRGVTVSRSASRAIARQNARREARQDAREKQLRAKRQAERAEQRAARATQQAVKGAERKLWTTTDLNLWSGPGAGAVKAGLVDGLEKVLVTGRRETARAEIVISGEARWVTADYLSAKKPEPEPETEAGPSLGGACTNGSSVASGVSASIADVHAAVCGNWPEITAYGTFRGDGEHAQGRAVDIMTSGSTGWAVAEFLRANYSRLGIEYIIFSQKIWSVERSGEGWRSMASRGSTTANHYDHVHVTVW